MSKPLDVLVVGELNVDLILNQIEVTPQLGKEVVAESMTLTIGGSSSIFACNLSILGTSVAFVGKMGQDSFGDYIISNLRSRGVGTDHILRSDSLKTGVTTVLNFDQDRSMITYPGAMRDLVLTDIPDDLLKQAKHLHVSSIFLQSGLMPDIIELFQKAKSFGLTTSIDPQWDPKENWDINLKSLLSFVDVFMPNSEELKWLTGKDNVQAAAGSLKGIAHILVVKDGVNGACLWHSDGKVHQEAFQHSKFIDSIGAGDSFDAGFIHKFLLGESLEVCLEFGALMGAINTTSQGGTDAFETYSKVQQTARSSFNYIL